MGKDPGLAVVASLLILGGGQFYTEQWLKGVALWALVVLIAVMTLIHPFFIVLFFPLAVYSIWDAYSAASGGSGWP